MAQKEEAVECDREGIHHAFVEVDREHEALRARTAEMEHEGALLEEHWARRRRRSWPGKARWRRPSGGWPHPWRWRSARW